MSQFIMEGLTIYRHRGLAAFVALLIITGAQAAPLLGEIDLNPASNDEFSLLFGWPRQIASDLPLWGRTISPVDLDGNQDWELSILSTDGRLNVFQHDGANFPRFPLEPYQLDRPQPWDNPAHRATSAIADVDGNGSADIVLITDIGFLHIIGARGDQPQPFPIDIGRDRNAGIPALIDWTGDHEYEIIFNSWPRHPDSLAVGQLNIIRNTGEPLDGWPVVYTFASTSAPAVGDITGDGREEIVIGSARHLNQPGRLIVWQRDGSFADGFPIGGFETIHGAPSLADISGDGTLDVVFWAAYFGGDSAAVFVVDGRGENVRGFPVDCPYGHSVGSPVAADITGDAAPEIVFGANGSRGEGFIYAWSSDGQMLDGFPIELDRLIIGGVILGDMDGDRIADIVAALGPGPRGEPGGVVAFTGGSDEVDGFPIDLAEFGGGSPADGPTAWDFDRDGDLDLALATAQRRLIVWDTPGYVTEDVWLLEKGNPARTGVRPADDPVRAPEVPAPLPSNITASAFPNPFNRSVRIAVPAQLGQPATFSLTDVAGRLVGEYQAIGGGDGTAAITVIASDYNLSGGIYLCRWIAGNSRGVVKILFYP